MIGVILAAGEGKRFKTKKDPYACKPLVEINNKPLIKYALDNLASLGVERAYIVIGKEGEMIKNALGNEYMGIKIGYIFQPEQLGLINAFVRALYVAGCDESIILQLSDEIFLNLKIEEIKKILEQKKYDFYCGITFEENPKKIKTNFSVVTDSRNIIRYCIEKPKTVFNNMKGTGFCVFNEKSLNYLTNTYDPQKNFPCDLCDYFNGMITEKQKGITFCVADKEFNINTVDDLDEAEKFLCKPTNIKSGSSCFI